MCKSWTNCVKTIGNEHDKPTTEKRKMNDLEYIIKNIRAGKAPKQVGFVSGIFNTLHIGHLRMLKFARANCDILVVNVFPDDFPGSVSAASERIESIRALEFVDYSFCSSKTLQEILEQLRPDIVFKGQEHSDRFNEEASVLEKIGGKIVFSSGSSSHYSDEVLDRKKTPKADEIGQEFRERHNIEIGEIREIINKFDKLKITVIGDVIVDDYILVDPIGLSREEPVVVFSKNKSQLFLGGAGIVAAHAASLGADVKFYSVVGDDETADFARQKLQDFKVNYSLFSDESRSTTLKQKFKSKGKTVFRINEVNSHFINDLCIEKILYDIHNSIDETDAIIFSDFNYGCLPQKLVDSVTEIALNHNVSLFSDSQISSQQGDIARFKNTLLTTPTEHEIRASLGDSESGLVTLANKLIEKNNTKNVIITLGSEGLLIHSPNALEKGELQTDKIPALSHSSVDTAGCGDVFLVGTALSMCVGANIWLSAYIGSLCASKHANLIGNLPINKSSIFSASAS